MEENSTINLSVKTLYENLDATESEQLHEAAKDPELQSEFARLARMKEALGSFRISPSTSSISVIMEHSRKTSALESTC